MAQEESKNKVGTIPEFTANDPVGDDGNPEEIKQPEVETPPEETETPAPPAEKPAGEETPSVDTPAPSQNVENPELERAVKGLQEERVKLLKEISELKGQRRELKQEELSKVEKQIDELKDLHPDDVSLIDRVLKAKGSISQNDVSKMFYKFVQDEELNGFLERYPEYKPENDPGDANWISLQREIGLYKTPDNPRQWREILERAHRSIVKVPSAKPVFTPTEVKKRQIQTASVGSGGKTGSAPASSSKSFSAEHKLMLRQGGFSEEEIASMESRRK